MPLNVGRLRGAGGVSGGSGVTPYSFGDLVGFWWPGDDLMGVNYQDGAGERLTNGNFQIGDPPSDWTATSGATLSAVAGARTGGSGTQYLKISVPGGDSHGTADQISLVVGIRYRLRGWARGDGVNGYPRIDDTGGTHWTGTTSATWQEIDLVFTATGTTLKLIAKGDLATTDFVHFDECSVMETPGIASWPSAYPDLTTGTVHSLTQATAANMPILDPTGWDGRPAAWFNGTAMFLTANTVASEFSGSDKPITVAASFQLLTRRVQYLWSMGEAGSNVHWHGQYEDGTNLVVRREDDGGVAKTATGSINPSTNRFRHEHCFTGTTFDGYINEAADVAGADLDVGTCTHDQMAIGCLQRAATTNFAHMFHGPIALYRSVTDPVGLSLYLKQWGY